VVAAESLPPPHKLPFRASPEKRHGDGNGNGVLVDIRNTRRISAIISNHVFQSGS